MSKLLCCLLPKIETSDCNFYWKGDVYAYVQSAKSERVED